MAPRKKEEQAATAAAAAATAAAAAAAQATKQKAASAAATDLEVPAVKRPRVDDTQAAPLQKPILPAAPDPDNPPATDQPARDIMKLVVPWVHDKLPEVVRGLKLLAEENLFNAKPLEISKQAEGDMCSYKESWKPQNCLLSCQQTGYYEAGANGLWIDPEVSCDGEVPFVDPGWNIVCQAGLSHLSVTEHNGVERIRFPVTMSCWWRSGVLALPQEGYPKGIIPLGGKPFLWAWYLEMFKAMDENDTKKIRLLYECILTVTVLMFTTSEISKIVEESIKMSETARTTAASSSDSFVTFASKILLIDKSVNVKDLALRDIRFQGGKFNTTMGQTIKHMQSSMLSSKDCLARLHRLDRSHGQEVLTGSYNKIKLFLSTTKNEPMTIRWVLDQMLTALDRKEISKSDFLLEAYKKPRNGSANFVQLAMATKVMVEHYETVVSGLATVDATLSQKLQDNVISQLCTPPLYNSKFPVEAAGSGVPVLEDGDAVDGSGVPVSEDDFMEKVSSTCPRSGVLLAEMIKKTYEGDYSDASTAIATAEQPMQTLHAMDEQVLGAFAKDMSELLKALHAAEAVVGLSSAASAPKATLRELVRSASDGGDKEQAAAERQDVWKRAVANRKKLVTLLKVVNPRLRSAYLDALNKASAFGSGFKGKPGEQHRVFVMSCDLMNQKGKQPWMVASAADDKIFEEMIAFVTTYGRSECDVIIAWDGCNRKSRRSLEDSVGQLPGSAEVFIVYSNSWNGWVKKKYHLGSENTECGYIVYAKQRNHVGAVKDRNATFCGAGESNSHFTSFTGVALPGRSTLARISSSDKEKIFSDTTDPLPKKWVDNVPVGVPMFWGETKSVSTWSQLLDEVAAGRIVDVTPGSGVLASAAMQRGTPYLGLVGNAHHLTWLTNVVDRNSCQYMCTTGNFLYQEDLATLLSELFADVVDAKEDQTAEEAIQKPDVD